MFRYANSGAWLFLAFPTLRLSRAVRLLHRYTAVPEHRCSHPVQHVHRARGCIFRAPTRRRISFAPGLYIGVNVGETGGELYTTERRK